MRLSRLFITLLLALVATSCLKTNTDKGLLVAKCYDKRLYGSDLAGITTPGMSPTDSIERAKNFIDNWINQQIILHQAEQSLSSDQLDFSEELDTYRNSLVVYAFETQIIEQQLDTVVTDDEIEQYYEQNKDIFHLRHDMVKVAYAIVKTSSKSVKTLRELLSDKDTLMIQQFNDIAEKEAIQFSSDIDTWIRLDDFLSIIPIEIYNPRNFFKKNKSISFEDDENTILVRFDDYLLQDDISPLEVEYDDIKSLILLKRKQELLRQMNTDLYNHAKKENAFEVYGYEHN